MEEKGSAVHYVTHPKKATFSISLTMKTKQALKKHENAFY